jgi:glycosyltransferase involved in cell wall biosynthesis
MHILLISHFFPPLNEVASIRAYCFAKYWDKAGVKVTVLTTNKSKNKGYKNLVKEISGSINVIEVDYHALFGSNGNTESKDSIVEPTLPFRKRSAVKSYLKKKIWDVLVYTGLNQQDLALWTRNAILFADKVIANENVTHIFSTYSPIQAHVIGSKLKRKYPHLKWIADYRDLWALNHIHRPGGIFNHLNIWFEKRTVNKYADLITVVSEPLKNQLESFFTNKIVKVVYNGYDPEDYNTATRHVANHTIIPTSTINIAYLGTIYEGFRDPTPLFIALNELLEEGELKEDDFCILFYGFRLGNLNEIIRKCNATCWTKIVGHVDYETSKQVQRETDLLLFLESGNSSAQGVLPGKLFEYIMSGTPVIGIGINAESNSGELIIRSNSGVVLGNNISAIKEFLIKFRRSPNYYKFSVNFEYFNLYSRKYQAECLLEEMKNM